MKLKFAILLVAGIAHVKYFVELYILSFLVDVKSWSSTASAVARTCIETHVDVIRLVELRRCLPPIWGRDVRVFERNADGPEIRRYLGAVA